MLMDILTIGEILQMGGEQLSYSILASQASTEILKNLTKKKRPNYKTSHSKKSFPSGHVSGVFISSLCQLSITADLSLQKGGKM